MEEGREVAAVLDGRLDERLAEQVLQALAAVPARRKARAALEKVVEIAEADPTATRQALWALRGDAAALARLEEGLGLSPGRATLSLGAAIQLASTELATPEPDLRGRMPELLRWLEGTW